MYNFPYSRLIHTISLVLPMSLWLKWTITHSKSFNFAAIYFKYHWVNYYWHPGCRKAAIYSWDGPATPVWVGTVSSAGPRLFRAVTQYIIAMQWGLCPCMNILIAASHCTSWGVLSHMAAAPRHSIFGVASSHEAGSGQHCVCPQKRGRGPGERQIPFSIKNAGIPA